MNNIIAKRFLLLIAATYYLLYVAALLFYILVNPGKERTLTHAWFFAIQTFTTTGYGSGFTFNDDLMTLSCVVMIIGSITWAIIVGLIVNWIWEHIRG